MVWRIIFTTEAPDWNESRRAVGKWVRGREAAVENADDAGWEATIPFVPFQSEIAYNVEIKRSRTPPGSSRASEVAR